MTDRVEENMKAWPRNILLVEDQRSMRMMIKRIVMLMGVPHVLEAADGMRALSILKDSRVDFAAEGSLLDDRDRFVLELRPGD